MAVGYGVDCSAAPSCWICLDPKNTGKYICIVGRAGRDEKVKISARQLFFETGTPCIIKTIRRGKTGGVVQGFDRKSKRHVVLSDVEEGEGKKVTCLIEGSQANVEADFTRTSNRGGPNERVFASKKPQQAK